LNDVVVKHRHADSEITVPETREDEIKIAVGVHPEILGRLRVLLDRGVIEELNEGHTETDSGGVGNGVTKLISRDQSEHGLLRGHRTGAGLIRG
jgi:hypothetical protein